MGRDPLRVPNDRQKQETKIRRIARDNAVRRGVDDDVYKQHCRETEREYVREWVAQAKAAGLMPREPAHETLVMIARILRQYER